MRIHRTLPLVLLAALAASPRPATAQQPTTVILVRHAEKDRSDPAARDPALTPAGEQRARDLARTIRRRPVRAIITTQFQRTRMTAQPAAEQFHVTPQVVPAAADGASTAAAVVEAGRRNPGGTVLVVGHSNTVPQIIEALGGPHLDEICDSQFSHLYVLVLRPGRAPRLTQSRYGAADPRPGPECATAMR